MLNKECMDKVQNRFDNLIKPVGSLAKLEKLVCMYAGAHSVTKLDYPQKTLIVIDFGATDLQQQLNCLAAAKLDENVSIYTINAIEDAAIDDVVQKLVDQGVGVLAFGYSGKELNSYDAEQCVQLMRHGILKAVECGTPVVLDGYLSTYAAYLASEVNPIVKDYLVASYKIADSEQAEFIDRMGLSELLSLHLGSENGLGSLLAFSLLNAGVRAYKDMRTFDEAKVEYAVEDLK